MSQARLRDVRHNCAWWNGREITSQNRPCPRTWDRFRGARQHSLGISTDADGDVRRDWLGTADSSPRRVRNAITDGVNGSRFGERKIIQLPGPDLTTLTSIVDRYATYVYTYIKTGERTDTSDPIKHRTSRKTLGRTCASTGNTPGPDVMYGNSTTNDFFFLSFSSSPSVYPERALSVPIQPAPPPA